MPDPDSAAGRGAKRRAGVGLIFGIALVAVTAPGPGAAAQFDDPEWPCIQRRVPELSMGQMWSGPPAEPDAASDPELQALARRLAPRRVSVEEIAAAAEAAVRSQEPATRPEWLAGLFAALLDRINAERGAVIAGIGRYAARQRALSEEIEAMQSELATLERAPEATRDMDKVEELEDHLAWEARIFRDRAQSLTYVCETPVLLERRAFAIGRALEGLI
jgi:hypothetical protein